MIKIKRVYDPPSADDGIRYLVDRLWPRGIRKEALMLDGWFRELAPADELRRAFHHKAERWEEFQQRYWQDLENRPETWKPIVEVAQKEDITLLYSARDREHNNALALKNFLDRKMYRNP
jgi:uncharacterized protein YeaO (DUF488 family)